MHTRRIFKPVLSDLTKKMVWIAGPRQCGKTTLAEEILKKKPGHYYNWDEDLDRKHILTSKLDPDTKLWVFDEIHKFRQWRNWLKGKYDKNRKDKSILVTGSAKLDLFSRGGDSLQGRYFFYRLHPFTLSEYLEIPHFKTHFDEFKISNASAKTAIENLMKFSGFPEPLFSKSEREADRWRLAYSRRLLRDDVHNLDLVKEIDRLELLYERLPATGSNIISINSLREDLEVSFETVRNWLLILENLYAIFRISPIGGPRIKAVKKEQKIYLWDWARIEDRAARFENLIAFHLLRLAHWCEDIEGKKTELRYFRDVTGREVDFIVLQNGKPWIAVEVKLKGQNIDKNLFYFLERNPTPYAFQVHLDGDEDFEVNPKNSTTKIRVIPATKFLLNLP